MAIGKGAREWLVEAAAVGTSRMRVKMHEAVQLARLLGHDTVDLALALRRSLAALMTATSTRSWITSSPTHLATTFNMPALARRSKRAWTAGR